MSSPVRRTVVLIGLLGAIEARAASFEFVWQAPPACPTDSIVRDEVRRLVGREPVNVRVDARVREIEDGFSADVALAGEVDGERHLEAESCASLARAVALIVALSIDPEALSRLSDRRASADSSDATSSAARVPVTEELRPDRATSGSASRRTPDATDEPKSEPFRFQIGAGPLVEWAWIPNARLGFEAHAAALHELFRIDLFGGAVLRESVEPRSASAPGASVGFGFVGARACGGGGGTIAGWLCLGVRNAWIEATGTGLPEPESATVNVWLVEPGVVARAAIVEKWSVELGARALLPTTSPEFVFADDRPDRATTGNVFTVHAGASLGLSIVREF